MVHAATSGFLLAILASSVCPVPLHSQIEGRWRADSTRSDDLARQIRLLADQGGLNFRSGFQGGPPTGGIPGAAGGAALPDRRPGPEEVARLTAAVEVVLQLAHEFEIRQTDSTVTIYPLDLRYQNQVFPTDGSKVTTRDDTGEIEIETRARWRDSALEVERKTDDIHTTQTFVTLPEGAALAVTINVRGRPFRRPFVLRRIYSAVE